MLDVISSKPNFKLKEEGGNNLLSAVQDCLLKNNIFFHQ
jgi:hypothetical protein